MLAGKIALVTGASRGIGQAIAQTLDAAGARVIGTATSESGAEAISASLSENSVGKVLNVTEPDSIDELLKSVNDELGAPVILVNNAGITRDTLLMRMKDNDWNAVIDTNLSSVYRMSKACMKGMMKARTGRIINISSVVATMGNAGQANYCAAKAGVEGLTRSMARELASRNITVNSVAPGFIDTDMTRALGDEQRDELVKSIPLARLGSADDIAQTVLFLASDHASYITGETIHVNGGMVMN